MWRPHGLGKENRSHVSCVLMHFQYDSVNKLYTLFSNLVVYLFVSLSFIRLLDITLSGKLSVTVFTEFHDKCNNGVVHVMC